MVRVDVNEEVFEKIKKKVSGLGGGGGGVLHPHAICNPVGILAHLSRRLAR